MNAADFTVFIVDDDASVLKALSRLVGALGYPVRAFSSPARCVFRPNRFATRERGSTWAA